MLAITDDFRVGLADILLVDASDLSGSLELNKANWDSVAQLATIALIDENFGITLAAKQLAACTTVGGLMELIQSARAGKD